MDLHRARQQLLAVLERPRASGLSSSTAAADDSSKKAWSKAVARLSTDARRQLLDWLWSASMPVTNGSSAATTTVYARLTAALLDGDFHEPRVSLLSMLYALSASLLSATAGVSATFPPDVARDARAKADGERLAAMLGANFFPYLLWVYLSLPVMAVDNAVETDGEGTNANHTAQQLTLHRHIQELRDAIEACWMVWFTAQAKQRMRRLHLTLDEERRARANVVRNVLSTASIYHRPIANGAAKNSSSASGASEPATIRHAITDARDIPLNEHVVAVTPGTLPIMVQSLVQLFEGRMGGVSGGDDGSVDGVPQLHAESMLVFCMASERLLTTGYEQRSPVAYLPEPPAAMLQHVPRSILRFQHTSTQIMVKLSEASSKATSSTTPTTDNAPIVPPASTTPSMARRVRSVYSSIPNVPIRPPSASTVVTAGAGQSGTPIVTTTNIPTEIHPNNGLPTSPLSTVTRSRGDSGTYRRPVQEQLLKNAALAQQEQAVGNEPVNCESSSTTPFRMQPRIVITRETARSILSVLTFILNMCDVDGDALYIKSVNLEAKSELPMATVDIEKTLWRHLFGGHADVEPLSATEERQRRNSSRRMSMSNKNSPNADALPEATIAEEEGDQDQADLSHIDIAVDPPSTDDESTCAARKRFLLTLKSFARRTLATLELRARYEMWWEIVMAAEHVPGARAEYGGDGFESGANGTNGDGLSELKDRPSAEQSGR